MSPNARVNAHELSKLRDQARREVVDAEVAHVLEAVQGLRATRTGHACDDHDVGDAVAALGVAHVLAGACVWHSSLLRSGGNRIKYRGWCPVGTLVLAPCRCSPGVRTSRPGVLGGVLGGASRRTGSLVRRGERPTIETLA
jgi:hypothetical protein